jgi:nucleosome binding factor SPN SPT16 subunit
VLTEKEFIRLRINFHNPNQTNKDVVLPKANVGTVWIKELTFKSLIDSKNLHTVNNDVKEALKTIK